MNLDFESQIENFKESQSEIEFKSVWKEKYIV